MMSSFGHVSPAVFATCTYSSYLFVCFLHDVKNVLKMYRLSSGEELRTFPLDVGSVVGFTGRKRDSEIFYYFTSFLSPGTRSLNARCALNGCLCSICRCCVVLQFFFVQKLHVNFSRDKNERNVQQWQNISHVSSN